MAPAVATYEPQDPSRTVLYNTIAAHLETFLASLDDDPDAKGLPDYVQREFYDYLQCGILAHGFLRLGCDSCQKEVLLAFSCKRRGFCPSCSGRRMAQSAAHLVECVMPWVPTRQWVVSVPIPLRYWTAPSRDLTAHVHGIIRTTIAQFYVNQAVKRGAERQNVQPGSVTFLQRFGGALQLNLHYHVIVMEGVFLDRTDQGLKPRFLKGEPPSDADVAHVVQKISRRVIRKLRRLGYLEAGMDIPVATGYDPLLDNEPELARTMAASVTQRIAFGERAGQKVRRIGSGFGYEGERPELKGPRCASVNGFSLHANTAIPAHRWDQLERLIRYTARGALSLERLEQDANGDLMYRFNRPWSDGTTGIKLSPLELLEKLAALVPVPRAHLVRYGGCLAPHSKLRAAIIPTPRQQGADGDESKTGTPYWHWARLLGRVFDLDTATCPFCRRGSLRIIAAITRESVITRILRHLQLASVPPPIAPARLRQEIFVFDEAHARVSP
jgi:putative transposase/transposase-like zinc-binding protein